MLFFVRFALYLYEAVSTRYVKGGGVVYPYLFYEVPELIPGALILLAMRHLRTLRQTEAEGEVEDAVMAAGKGDAQQSLISQRYSYA